jgi:hypothetical protein
MSEGFINLNKKKNGKKTIPLDFVLEIGADSGTRTRVFSLEG